MSLRPVGVAAALVLISCAWPRGFLFRDTPYPVAFVTTCGLRVLGPYRDDPALPLEWTPARVQNVEDRAVTAFKPLGHSTFDRRFDDPCAQLARYSVQVVPQKNFVGIFGEEGGETDCGMIRVFVGNSAPEVGRLAHELAHVIQRCDATGGSAASIDPHYDWAPIEGALSDAGLPL